MVLNVSSVRGMLNLTAFSRKECREGRREKGRKGKVNDMRSEGYGGQAVLTAEAVALLLHVLG